MPTNKEDNPMLAQEEKQIMRGLDLSKFKIPPAREMKTSHPTPLVMENSSMASYSATASIMVAINTQSQVKGARDGATMPVLCPNCPAPLPGGIRLVRRECGQRAKEREEERETKKDEQIKQRQDEENQTLNSSSNYYPLEPIYLPNHKEWPPTVINNLILSPEISRDTKQDKRDIKTEDNRRIIMKLLDEERDLDYYLDSESETDYVYQSYV